MDWVFVENTEGMESLERPVPQETQPRQEMQGKEGNFENVINSPFALQYKLYTWPYFLNVHLSLTHYTPWPKSNNLYSILCSFHFVNFTNNQLPPFFTTKHVLSLNQTFRHVVTKAPHHHLLSNLHACQLIARFHSLISPHCQKQPWTRQSSVQSCLALQSSYRTNATSFGLEKMLLGTTKTSSRVS